MFPGTEAINFQPESTLGKKLTALFQKVMDYRDNLDYSKVSGEGEVAQRRYRITKVTEYFTQTASKEFLKILKDEAGLLVRNLIMDGGPEAGLNFSFAISLDMSGMGEAAAATIERISGNYEYGAYDYGYGATEAEEDFSHLCDCLDLENATLNKQFYGVHKKRQLYVTKVYFDINVAFLLADYVNTEHYVAPLTAREVAAIMLHEVGHALTVIEHSGDMYATRARLVNFATHISNGKDPKVAKAAFDAITKNDLSRLTAKVNEIASRSKSNYLRAAIGTINGLAGCINKLYAATSSDKDTGSYTLAGVGVVTNLIAMLLNIFFALLSDVVALALGVLIFSELDDMNTYDRNVFGKKAGDSYGNYNRTFTIERWADEFAVRCGYGDALASSLNKMRDASWWYACSPVNSDILNHCTIYSCMVSGYIWVFKKILILTYLDPTGYENDYRRAKRILENTLAIFKNDKLTNGMALEWLQKLESIELEIKKAKETKDSAVAVALVNLLSNVANPIGWMKLLYNGRLARDCEVIENNLDALENNKLYALSYAFKAK